MTNNQKAMYTGLAMCRNTEITLLWSRSQFFAFLLFVVSSLVIGGRAGLALTPLSLLPLGMGSTFLGLLWIILILRTREWTSYWESCLEAFDQTEPEPAEVPLFSGPTFECLVVRPFSFHRVLLMLAGVLTMQSVLVTIWAFFL